MDEYISRQEAITEIKSRISTANDAWESGYNTAIAEITEWIKHIPAADVQPVQHERWITDTDSGETYCSRCKWIPTWDDEKYCANCGAKMDGDSK